VLPWLLTALVPVAALVAWWLLRTPVLEVTVASAVASTSASTSRGTTVLDASGYVVARREATVSSKVTGKIAEVLIEEGMSVRGGQVVARLDAQSLRPELELAATQLRARRTEREEAQVRHVEAARNLDRIQRLRKDGLVSEADLDKARAEHDALAARLDALSGSIDVAAAAVRVYEQQLDDLVVRAPFDGVIVSKDAQPGEMVSPVSAGGGFTRTGIATLVDMDSREIEVDVNEAFINRVSANQRTEAMLDAYPDWRIASHVINIVPTADRQKATVRVRIAFDELDPRILPNMGIKVSFLDAASAPPKEASASGAPSRPSVLVPEAAVARDGDARVVWRVRDTRADRVAVSTGSERSGQIELLSGIDAGDTVIVSPPAELTPGAAVRPLGN
jgi:RND family efflux transporter MFP subunit